MRATKNCSNYIYEHAKPIFTAGAVICVGMALKTYLTPQGDTHATYKAVRKATPQIFLGLSALFGTLAVVSSAKKSNRKDPFTRDLEFVRTTILENHPGVYDVLNPNFLSSLPKSYKIAQQQLNLSDSVEKKALALKNFGKSFQDAHLWVQYDFAKTSQIAKMPQRMFGVQKLKYGVVWIDIPTFEPSKSQIQELEEITRAMPQLRDQVVVFDLCGNGGGNSAWGTGLLKALFGEEYSKHCLTQLGRNVTVEWRASRGNLEHMQQLIPQFKQKFGPIHPTIEWAENIVQGMKSAILRGDRYYSASDSSTPTSVHVANAFNGKIIAIVDKGCGSACLDFLDGLKALHPNVTLVGETTGADTAYMELRTVRLPSNQGNFGFPIKVYRNRPRGHNAPYVPDVEFVGDLRDTAALQKFILNI